MPTGHIGALVDRLALAPGLLGRREAGVPITVGPRLALLGGRSLLRKSAMPQSIR
jgi:hypothetical protein